MSNTEALRARLLAHAEIHDAETSPYSPEQAQWAADLREAAAALAQQPAASVQPVAHLLTHLYSGDCPDDNQPHSRDPDCPACRAMDAAPQPAPARVPLTDERLNAAGLDYALADSFRSGSAEWVAQDIANAFKAGARAAERYYTAPPVNQSLTTAGAPDAQKGEP